MDGVNRVQTKCIYMIVPEPVKSVLDEEVPHLIAVGIIEVEGASPGSAILLCEVGAEFTQVVSLRTQMVVDHIKDHGQATSMAGINQPL